MLFLPCLAEWGNGHDILNAEWSADNLLDCVPGKNMVQFFWVEVRAEE